MNTNTYEIIFPLLRSALWGEEKFPFQCDKNIDWNSVYEELKAQTVHQLPIDILIRVDSANCMTYYRSATTAVRRWHDLMKEQQELYELLQKENIPFVILKGSAADCYYPKPMYRSMGDVDFIVKPENFERTVQCMMENGYENTADFNPRHLEFTKNGIIFELHKYFSILMDRDSEKWQDDLIFTSFSNIRSESIEDYTFPMLPSLENGLVLLTHINQHMENGLGLRQIIDWMLYVDKEMTDDFWDNSFGPAVERTGLKTLAITTTRMCQMYLGLTKELTFCKEADESLCQDLMNYIIDNGNFGRKIDAYHNAAIRVLSISNLPDFFATLQSKGAKNWIALEKHPWLRPFAWLYQICRYIRILLTRENSISQLKEEYSQGKFRDDFLNRLQVYRQFENNGE